MIRTGKFRSVRIFCFNAIGIKHINTVCDFQIIFDTLCNCLSLTIEKLPFLCYNKLGIFASGVYYEYCIKLKQ